MFVNLRFMHKQSSDEQTNEDTRSLDWNTEPEEGGKGIVLMTRARVVQLWLVATTTTNDGATAKRPERIDFTQVRD